jgi:hypothetical protein
MKRSRRGRRVDELSEPGATGLDEPEDKRFRETAISVSVWAEAGTRSMKITSTEDNPGAT